jgi:hypothetical protein
MFALFFAKLFSPSSLFLLFKIILASGGLYTAYSFISNYSAVKEQNLQLENNLATAKLVLQAQTNAAEQQHAIDQTTVDSIRQQGLQAATDLATAQGNIQALKDLRKPTSEDDKCSRSPYVSTIFNRVRQQRTTTPTITTGH